MRYSWNREPTPIALDVVVEIVNCVILVAVNVDVVFILLSLTDDVP